MKNTKIVATIGPACDTPHKMKQLINSGVNVFRFNTKHATIDWHNKRIKLAQKVAQEMNEKIGIMIDLQGKEIRAETRDEEDLLVKKNKEFLISDSFNEKETLLVIKDDDFFKKIGKNDYFLIDDGLLKLKVIKASGKSIMVRAMNGGLVKNRKSINLPGKKMQLSSLIKRDIKNLDSAAKNNVAFVALSFVNNKQDLLVLRKEMQKRKMKASIVAKIENENSILNIDEIIDEADAIMIARGDLGIEMPIQELAYWQKEIIKKSREKSKPVIVATQMLHSMTTHKRPTRAEATDVANAVFDGSDALMLSEETAIGNYPIEATKEMTKIIKFNEERANVSSLKEKSFNYTQFVARAIASELKKLEDQEIKTAVVFTESGYTARLLSSFRLKMKIVAVSNQEKVAEQLSLSYGVIGRYDSIKFDNLEISPDIIKMIKSLGLASKDETIAVFHGRYDKKPDLLTLFSLTKVK